MPIDFEHEKGESQLTTTGDPPLLKTLRRCGDAALRFILYPTGEFSATKVRETGSLVPDNYAEGYEKAIAYLGRSCACPGRPTASFAAEQTAPLGLSNVPNSHRQRKARGRKGISRYNKRLIVNSCLLLERKYGRSHLGFLTLTLPSECANGSAESYREAKRQMLQWFQRTLGARGLPGELVGCTEVQVSRLHQRSEFALHEHWVYVGRLPHQTWAIRPVEIQSKWIEILGRVFKVGIAPPHSKSAVNVQRVQRSAAAYLGKYISKGSDVIEYAIERGIEHMLPSSWVTRSISMLRLFRSSIVRFNIEDSRSIHDVLQDNVSTFCRWARNITIEMDSGHRVWLAFCGYLNIEGLKLIRFQYPEMHLTGVLCCN